MSSYRRSAYGPNQGVMVSLRPAPLGSRDLEIVQATLAEVAPAWTVELHGICSEEATLVVLPEDGDDALGPSFAVSRESYGLRLDQIHWDELTELGLFASLSDVIDTMANILSGWSDFSLPPTVTVH